jgi:hypothetical protein
MDNNNQIGFSPKAKMNHDVESSKKRRLATFIDNEQLLGSFPPNNKQMSDAYHDISIPKQLDISAADHKNEEDVLFAGNSLEIGAATPFKDTSWVDCQDLFSNIGFPDNHKSEQHQPLSPLSNDRTPKRSLPASGKNSITGSDRKNNTGSHNKRKFCCLCLTKSSKKRQESSREAAAERKSSSSKKRERGLRLVSQLVKELIQGPLLRARRTRYSEVADLLIALIDCSHSSSLLSKNRLKFHTVAKATADEIEGAGNNSKLIHQQKQGEKRCSCREVTQACLFRKHFDLFFF